jgi:hypothetical protein
MMVEIYGNILTFNRNATWNYQRGGRVLMFNNRNIMPAGSNSIWQDDDFDPDVYCVTDGGAAIVSPNTSFFFNNWVNSTLQNCEIRNNPFGHLGLNKSAWNYNASCTGSSCSSGVGCGSSAPTGTCTTGVGYWVTSYSPCSTPPTAMADMKTYIQAGRFYRCTTTNTWTLYYTPYTYPHPLRGGGPSAPKGLTILGSSN